MLQGVQPVMLASPAIIDTQEILYSFDLFMRPETPFHLLSLVGSAKTGKSHLLMKIFPFLAEQVYQAHVVRLDVRHQSLTVPKILNAIASCLDRQLFQGYFAAHQAWYQRPQIAIQDSKAFLSFVSISAASNSSENASNRDAFLTAAFLQELAQHPKQSLVLLIDNIDRASVYVQDWLIREFLAQALPLAHLRFVIAAQTPPQLDEMILASTLISTLGPVPDVEAFLSYCRIRHPNLVEQSVRDLARASRYVPGLFAELAAAWEEEGDAHE